MIRPKTVQVGISSSPFLRELELNYNRMATKKELEEVQKFLLKSIDDLKTGRFKAD